MCLGISGRFPAFVYVIVYLNVYEYVATQVGIVDVKEMAEPRASK